jgi:hypothetical protein
VLSKRNGFVPPIIWPVNWKKLISISLVVFALYFLVRSPVESATFVRSVANTIGDVANAAATSLTTFIRTLV